MTSKIEKYQQIAKTWGDLTPAQRAKALKGRTQDHLNNLLPALTPDQQEQVKSFLENYKEGKLVAFNYAMNILAHQVANRKVSPRGMN